MIKRIDHVSLGVRDLSAARRFFLEVLGGREVWSEPAPGQGFRWTLVELGDSCLLELIDPVGEEPRFLHRFLERRGDGVHHLTLHVDDVEAVKARLDEAGVETFGLGAPYPGWKELYVHPRQAFGVLIQFAQFRPLDWVRPGDPVPGPYRGFAEAERQEALADLLQLGDPGLRQPSAPIADLADPALPAQVARLKEALTRVRAALGFGRALAAPQLGLHRRLLALDLGQGPFVMINPELEPAGEETFTLWDDCLSFPDLLVRVRRQATVSLRFLDEAGQEQRWAALDRATSELLQHEVDHLDGVLAVDRALDRDSIVTRAAFERHRARFEAQVDGR